MEDILAQLMGGPELGNVLQIVDTGRQVAEGVNNFKRDHADIYEAAKDRVYKQLKYVQEVADQQRERLPTWAPTQPVTEPPTQTPKKSTAVRQKPYWSASKKKFRRTTFRRVWGTYTNFGSRKFNWGSGKKWHRKRGARKISRRNR